MEFYFILSRDTGHWIIYAVIVKTNQTFCSLSNESLISFQGSEVDISRGGQEQKTNKLRD